MPEGIKYDTEKARWSLLPYRELTEVVCVLTLGSKKYADENWKKVQPQPDRYFSAAMRHLTAWWGGEKKDPETGKSHLAHVVCCLLFLMWFDNEAKDAK